MQPPKWAQDLLLDALLHANSDNIPELVWRKANRHNSSGRCQIVQPYKLTICAGHDRTDAKLVLLHEAAHAITREAHAPHFWDVAWELFRWAKLPINYCKQREFEYKAGAVLAYKRGK